MHQARVTTTFQFVNYICYVFLLSGGIGQSTWGVLANYLPEAGPAAEASVSQQDKIDEEADDSPAEKSFLARNDILKSLSKLHMLALGEASESPDSPTSGFVVPVYDQEADENADMINEIAGDDSSDSIKRFSPYAFQGSRGKKRMTGTGDKKAHVSLGFVGSRGKRQPASLGFVGSRGKKQVAVNFVPGRGRRHMSTAFVGSRGKRTLADEFSPSRGRRIVNSQAFVGSRGKRYSSALDFLGSRGKKDSDFENLLLKNEDAWSKANYNRRAVPIYHGFVGSRGKRSTETS